MNKDHKYSIRDMERMRVVVADLMFPNVWLGPHSSYRPGSGGMQAGEFHLRVEEQLRTYMLNGTTPEELESLQKERAEQFERERPAAA